MDDLTNCATNGAMIPPTLAAVDENPNPTVLMAVGYNSAVYMYIPPNASDTEHFPIIPSAVEMVPWSENIENFMVILST